MRKRIVFVALLAATLVMLASCSSTVEETRMGAMGYFPVREVEVTSLADLQSGSFEVIGTVSGVGRVDVDDAERGDSMGYGSLEVLDVDRMYYGLDWMVAEDPYAVSLANAVNEMINNARSMGAAFVTFPSYTVEIIDGEAVATASAIAVKLIDCKVVPVVVAETEAEADYTVKVDATVSGI